MDVVLEFIDFVQFADDDEPSTYLPLLEGTSEIINIFYNTYCQYLFL